MAKEGPFRVISGSQIQLVQKTGLPPRANPILIVAQFGFGPEADLAIAALELGVRFLFLPRSLNAFHYGE
jgi:hypothetical protein